MTEESYRGASPEALQAHEETEQEKAGEIKLQLEELKQTIREAVQKSEALRHILASVEANTDKTKLAELAKAHEESLTELQELRTAQAELQDQLDLIEETLEELAKY